MKLNMVIFFDVWKIQHSLCALLFIRPTRAQQGSMTSIYIGYFIYLQCLRGSRELYPLGRLFAQGLQSTLYTVVNPTLPKDEHSSCVIVMLTFRLFTLTLNFLFQVQVCNTLWQEVPSRKSWAYLKIIQELLFRIVYQTTPSSTQKPLKMQLLSSVDFRMPGFTMDLYLG